MKNSTPFIALTLLALAFAGCSKKQSVADLGVIELAPNVPKHIKIGDADWTITENRDARGKLSMTAESPGRKVTQKDISDSSAAPNTKVGATIKETIDLSQAPSGIEIIGNFGGRPASYTLKHDAN